ncbi:MAG TPA: peptidoglycan-binding domain-containing protein [Burkholderiales bacterium]
MNSRILMIVLLMPFGAFAADEPAKPPADNSAGPTQQPVTPQQAVTPQAADPQQQAADPYIDFNKRVQERLTALGFYTGPINGDIGPNSQAALAQFQLSVPIPASGALDDQTVAALGLERSVQASAGASTDSPPATAPAQQPADQAGAKPSAESSPPKREQGGSVEASTNAEASSGASRPAEVKGN